MCLYSGKSIIQPIDIPPQIASFDIWVMLRHRSAGVFFFARSGASNAGRLIFHRRTQPVQAT
jgi:hypothetical protein